MIDALEPRRLMADVSLIGGKLQILGTSGDDAVGLALFGKTDARVYVGGEVVFTFDLRQASVISFAGLAGNDSLIVGNVPLRAYMDGGAGNDALSASRFPRNDTLLGRDGNDYLFGGPGNDFLQGGLGYDSLLGYDGDDTLRALSDSNGDDTVSGGEGFDSMDATDYTRGVKVVVGDRSPGALTVDDVVFEDVEAVLGTGFSDNVAVVSGRPVYVDLARGYDVFTGGRGNDTVFGGRGVDRIFAAGGNDLIIDQDDEDADTLTGGTGTDTVYYADGDVVEAEISTLDRYPGVERP